MKNTSRIIMLVQFPFEPRDYERFGIEIFKANGFEIEVWDFSPFMNQGFFRNLHGAGIQRLPHHRIFISKDEALTALKELSSSCFIVSFIIYGRSSYEIYGIIFRMKIGYAMYVAGASYPPVAIKTKNKNNPLFFLGSKIKSMANKEKIRARLSDIIFRIKLRPPDYIIAGGAKNHFCSIPLGVNTKVIWAHCLDYDIYLKEKEAPVINTGNTAVFLDGNVPFHRDLAQFKTPIPHKPEDYFGPLCRFFSYIEKTKKIRVVIAAHPRAEYDTKPDFFEGRRVFKHQTARLVKECQFVIAHASYSINYAVLFKKPILFITTDKLNQHIYRCFIDAMVEAIGKKAININNYTSIDWDNELLVDESAYARYKHNHIKKDGTEELPFWQIVANRIKNL